MIQEHEVSNNRVRTGADEVEDGDEACKQRKGRGRPLRAERASKVITTRFSEAELAELNVRAEREGIDRSTAIRVAVHEWATA